MMHMCERCRKRDHDLTHFKPADEYLCDNCYAEAAKEYEEFLRYEEGHQGE